jgi:neurotransmitter:Na+ symporter, NSS family
MEKTMSGSTSEKQEWSQESGYIWSLIGSAVGFANILSFSALCYKNGGGAFLIPYIIAHLLIGIPMLFLEGGIGQRLKIPQVAALRSVAGRIGAWSGWLAVLSCATIGGFYIVLTGFSVAYFFFSLSGGLPSSDAAYFFKHTFLHDSGSLTQFGGIAWGVLLSTVAVVAFTAYVLGKDIQKGVERLCSVFLPLLAIMVILFSLFVLFLPGSFVGVSHFIIPDFSKLASWTLWRDVFGQVFFSLSLGLGIVVGYSRYNPNSFNIPRAMVRVALGDFLISLISGFAIFGCIGFMSFKSGMDFATLVPSDSAFEIGFIVFPTLLAQLGPVLGGIFGALFFFCIFIAGVTGVFSIVESVVGNFCHEFGFKRERAVAYAMGLISMLAFPFCLGNGQHLIGCIAPMVLGNLMLYGGMVEIALFLFFSDTFAKDSLWVKEGRSTWAALSLKLFVLPLLALVFFGALQYEFASLFQGEIAAYLRFAWLFLAMGVAAGAVLLARRQAVLS